MNAGLVCIYVSIPKVLSVKTCSNSRRQCQVNEMAASILWVRGKLLLCIIYIKGTSHIVEALECPVLASSCSGDINVWVFHRCTTSGQFYCAFIFHSDIGSCGGQRYVAVYTRRRSCSSSYERYTIIQL